MHPLHSTSPQRHNFLLFRRSCLFFFSGVFFFVFAAAASLSVALRRFLPLCISLFLPILPPQPLLLLMYCVCDDYNVTIGTINCVIGGHCFGDFFGG